MLEVSFLARLDLQLHRLFAKLQLRQLQTTYEREQYRCRTLAAVLSVARPSIRGAQQLQLDALLTYLLRLPSNYSIQAVPRRELSQSALVKHLILYGWCDAFQVFQSRVLERHSSKLV